MACGVSAWSAVSETRISKPQQHSKAQQISTASKARASHAKAPQVVAPSPTTEGWLRNLIETSQQGRWGYRLVGGVLSRLILLDSFKQINCRPASLSGCMQRKFMVCMMFNFNCTRCRGMPRMDGPFCDPASNLLAVILTPSPQPLYSPPDHPLLALPCSFFNPCPLHKELRKSEVRCCMGGIMVAGQGAGS